MSYPDKKGRFDLAQWSIIKAAMAMPLKPRTTLRHTDQWSLPVCALYLFIHVPAYVILDAAIHALESDKELDFIARMMDWGVLFNLVGYDLFGALSSWVALTLHAFAGAWIFSFLIHVWHIDQRDRKAVLYRTFTRLLRLSTWLVIWVSLAQFVLLIAMGFNFVIFFILSKFQVFVFIALITWLTGESPFGLSSPWPARCEYCGYERISNATVMACSECGQAYDIKEIQSRPQRKAGLIKYRGRFHDIPSLPSGLSLLSFFFASSLVVILFSMVYSLLFTDMRYSLNYLEFASYAYESTFSYWLVMSATASLFAKPSQHANHDMPIAMRISQFQCLPWAIACNPLVLILILILEPLMAANLQIIYAPSKPASLAHWMMMRQPIYYAGPLALSVAMVRTALKLKYRMD